MRINRDEQQIAIGIFNDILALVARGVAIDPYLKELDIFCDFMLQS
jgi:hypothetical protein